MKLEHKQPLNKPQSTHSFKSIDKKYRRHPQPSSHRISTKSVFEALQTGKPLELSSTVGFDNNVGYVCNCCLNAAVSRIKINSEETCKRHKITPHHKVRIQSKKNTQETSHLSDSESTHKDIFSITELTDPSDSPRSQTDQSSLENFEDSQTYNQTESDQPLTHQEASNLNVYEILNNPLFHVYFHLISELTNNFYTLLQANNLFLREHSLFFYTSLLAYQYVTLTQQGIDVSSLQNPMQLDPLKYLYTLCKHLEFVQVLGENYQELFGVLDQENFAIYNILTKLNIDFIPSLLSCPNT